MTLQQHSKGVTLVEMILYISLSAFVLLISGAFTTRILLQKEKLTAMIVVTQNADFVIEHLRASIRSAQRVSTPLVGASAGTLTLETNASTTGPINFSVVNGVLLEQDGSSVPFALSSNEVQVTAMQFQNVAYPNAPDAIRISLTLQYADADSRAEYIFAQDFFTTEVVRTTP
jgi:hypothetical protein